MRLKHASFTVPALGALAFGLYPTGARLAYDDGASSSFVILVATLMRAAALAGFCSLTGRRLLAGLSHPGVYLAGGVLQAASIFGIIASLAYLPGPVTITLVFTHTTLLLLFMAMRGEVRLDALAVTTTLAALLGVALVVDLAGNLNDLAWPGIALAMLASVATAGRLHVFGQAMTRADPAVVGARVMTIALICFSPLLVIAPPVLPDGLPGYAGVALCSASLVLGSFGMFYGIAVAGPFRFSLIAKLEPLFTALFAWLLLAEKLAGLQYLGVVLVVASLLAYQWGRHRQTPLARPSA